MSDAPVRETEPKDIGAKILPEDVERARRQVGIPKHAHAAPYNTAATRDAMRHFAFSCGEDNPLWQDEAYGRKTRWGDQIAPPMLLVSTGINLTPKYTPELKALFKGLFKGVSKYYSGCEWTWWNPIYPDAVVYTEETTCEVALRETSRFSGRPTVTEIYRHLYVDADGLPLAKQEQAFVSAEREGSRKTGAYNEVKRQVYTPQDIARIDAVYAAEQLRGAEPRFWEDVEVGDEVTPVAKGPLTMVDIIAYHMGRGLSHYGIGPLKLNYKQRQRMPGFYVDDRYGVPDVAQRVHWDHDRAQDLGLPSAHDYGQMRANWLSHLVTNWMGDDAWLWKLSAQTRTFNFLGDSTICSGKVMDKRVQDGHHVVELQLESVNQRGVNSCPGSAVVILPTRDAPVKLPEPPPEFFARGKAIKTLISVA